MTSTEAQIMKWVDWQLANGKTRDQMHNTTFIKGASVITLKKSGKTKWNLHYQVGCVVLEDK